MLITRPSSSAKLVGQHLHIASKNDQIDLLFLNHRKQFCFLFNLGRGRRYVEKLEVKFVVANESQRSAAYQPVAYDCN